MIVYRNEFQSRHVLHRNGDAERVVFNVPAGRDSVVSDNTERSESECEPMPRSPAISRMETGPVPTVSTCSRPNGRVASGNRAI